MYTIKVKAEPWNEEDDITSIMTVYLCNEAQTVLFSGLRNIHYIEFNSKYEKSSWTIYEMLAISSSWQPHATPVENALVNIFIRTAFQCMLRKLEFISDEEFLIRPGSEM